MIIGNCKMCGSQNVDLLESHIIPEFIYTPVYDKQHRYIDFSENPKSGVNFAQKGVRENLLCKNCEVKLSVYENKLKQFIISMNTNSGALKIYNLPGNKVVTKIDYNPIKLALLSILYRMSISRLTQFNGYLLGPKEEEIRKIIYYGTPTDRYKFGVHISQVAMNNGYYPDIIMSYEQPTKYKSHYTIKCFVIYGYLIEINVSNIDKSDIWHFFSLREKGKIIIQDIDVSRLNIKQDLVNRFDDNDVKKYMSKLKR